MNTIGKTLGSQSLVLVLVLSLTGLALLSSCTKKNKVERQKDTVVSYAMGVQVGKDIKNRAIEFDAKAFQQGIDDAVKRTAEADEGMAFSDKEMHEALINSFRKGIIQKNAEGQSEAQAKTRAKSIKAN